MSQEVVSRAAEAEPRRCPVHTILVVEDDDDVRSLVGDVLSGMGHRVLTATDGPAALVLLRSAVVIDLMFTDVVMPGGLNGMELADIALLLRPALKVLYTSGYLGHPVAGARPILSGASFLPKPYRPAKLINKITALLDA